MPQNLLRTSAEGHIPSVLGPPLSELILGFIKEEDLGQSAARTSLSGQFERLGRALLALLPQCPGISAVQ